MNRRAIRLGADIGGTFTDVVLEKGDNIFSTKVLTTYTAPENAIIDGMHQVCARAGITPGEIGQIIHGTTLATNALIERRGAKNRAGHHRRVSAMLSRCGLKTGLSSMTST